MLDLPYWIKDNLSKLKCPKCDVKIEHKNIINVGLTLVDKKHKHTHVYIGCLCSKCKAVFEFILDEMSMEEFVMTMLEQYAEEEERIVELEEDMDEFEEEHGITKVPYKKKNNSKPKAKKKQPVKGKSKIGDEEVSSFIKDLNSSASYDDFLRKMKIAHNKNNSDKKWN